MGRGFAYVAAMTTAAALATAAPAVATAPGQNGRIWYTSTHGHPSPLIWVMEADGSNQREFRPRTAATEVTASADGKLAYVSGAHLVVRHLDGTDNGIGDAWPYDVQGGPSWSPDGQRLAYHVQGITEQGVWTVDPDGRNRRRAAQSGRDPDWSPDGSRLVYEHNLELWTVELRTGLERRLTYHQGRDEQPSWSGDGTRIAFVHEGDIWTMRPDGSGQRRLTATTAAESHPAFSPDGTSIAFARSNPHGGSDILAIPAAGGSAEYLSHTSDRDAVPAWAPASADAMFDLSGKLQEALASNDPPAAVATLVAALEGLVSRPPGDTVSRPVGTLDRPLG